jgi:hypothetical protein
LINGVPWNSSPFHGFGTASELKTGTAAGLGFIEKILQMALDSLREMID